MSARSTTSEYQPSPPGYRLRKSPKKSPARRVRLGKGANCGGPKPVKITYSF